MKFAPRRLFLLPLAALLPLGLAGCGGGADPEPAAATQPSKPPVDCAVDKCVALTFDDGPGQFTGRLLDELSEAEAHATFFVLGENVKKYPDEAKRIVDEGHQIGSHSWDHKDITTLTAEGIEHEVDWTDQAVQDAAGVTPGVFRPPYGAHGVVYDRLIAKPLVLWDVDTLDWKHHDPVKTVDIAMDEVHNGSIVLMHDIHESSVQAVPDLVQALRKAGYELVTVDKLFDGQQFENSTAYASRLEAQEK